GLIAQYAVQLQRMANRLVYRQEEMGWVEHQVPLPRLNAPRRELLARLLRGEGGIFHHVVAVAVERGGTRPAGSGLEVLIAQSGWRAECITRLVAPTLAVRHGNGE